MGGNLQSVWSNMPCSCPSLMCCLACSLMHHLMHILM